MDERILEIVIYMVSRLREDESDRPQISDMARDLQSQGFTEREISSAYSWMFDRYGGEFDRLSRREEATLQSTRVLAPRERLAVSADAFGYLGRLVTLGILRRADLEEVIEACVQSGRHDVTTDEMKMIVSGALFGADTRSFGAAALHTDENLFLN